MGSNAKIIHWNSCLSVVVHIIISKEIAEPESYFENSAIKQTSGEWSYIATFGKQSLNNDMMGLAVFYKTKQLIKTTEDNLNHVIILKPVNGQVEYYFMPTWELDWEPVKDKAAFEKCINEVLNRLNNPVSYIIHP